MVGYLKREKVATDIDNSAYLGDKVSWSLQLSRNIECQVIRWFNNSNSKSPGQASLKRQNEDSD